ncbi:MULTISPECIES: ATP-binding protein [unclassified Variovorax]|jgi:two-component system osmolarity sensor histidine kinase EnvZ|uniref:ATP-binding protein n=1 Tax=unclassified Variovorax TaxID=663243 RepID=UPI0008C1AC05|nr:MULTISPECIES: ATP-binding protein [unclassified Variovorax]SEJ80385.1 two-component system, OmpR family, osmolarity sensor histidine kinase EnvZ [Variovorax sp. OK202]SFC93523.1 two-component system, OmpR family, osmolarity sensor histidine kinase EnvZ [Variovorax sp. OK212]
MKFLPRSLFGRNALLIVTLIALGQIGGGLLLREMIIKPRLDQIADSVARNVAAIRAGLVALPPAQRPAFVEGFNRQALAGRAERADRAGRADKAREQQAVSPRVLLTPLERGFVRSVSARVASQGVEAVWRRETDGGLALRLTLDGSDHWVVMPGVLPAREFTGAMVAVSIGSALLALAGALWFQRRLNRPLVRVVEAARTLARGQEPAPLPEDGPTEVATVSRSFNQLVGSLRQTERERALMLAGISHDLRTPLTKLRLGVEIVRDRMEPELVSSMTRSVEEMDAIVGQFLDFARGDADERLAPASLDDLARSLAEASADHGRPVSLQLGGVPLLPLRPQAMQRAIGNLVENAWRHGRAPVTLSTRVSGEEAIVEVADHGDGIDPAEAEALKQAFRRGHADRSGAAGAGLGLAIVQRVAQAHGGRLELDTPPGQGLHARLCVPLHPSLHMSLQAARFSAGSASSAFTS